MKCLTSIGGAWYYAPPIRDVLGRIIGISFLFVWVQAPGILIGFAWGRYSYRVHDKILARSLRDIYKPE